MRDKTGRFINGYSGNPGGRPKDEHSNIDLAQKRQGDNSTSSVEETLVRQAS